MEMSFTLKDLREVDINILDEKEKQKCEEAFYAFDKNQSKTLEKEELKKVLEGITIAHQRNGSKSN